MTQEERFEKWFDTIDYDEYDSAAIRNGWHAALEPAELEWKYNKISSVVCYTKNAVIGTYTIMIHSSENKYLCVHTLDDCQIVLVKDSSIDTCKQICNDHYRRAATRMINKLTGCE